MEEQRLLLDGFTAPFGNSGQEPGDGKDDPPHTARHGKEVQHHEKQRAGLVMRALSHCGRFVLAGIGCVTCHTILQQKAQEKHQRNHHVADGVEDDGPLRVAEACDVDEEGEEGEECGGEADDGDDANEVAGEGELVAPEVHVVTGRGAVAHTEKRVAELGLHFQLTGAPEAIVTLNGYGRLVSGVLVHQQIYSTRVRLLTVWKPAAKRPRHTYLHIILIIYIWRVHLQNPITCFQKSRFFLLRIQSNINQL